MTNINLLAWREQLREERKRDFLVAMGVVVAIAAVLLFLADRFENNRIDNQVAQNGYLTGEIAALDLKLTEIRELREQKALLTARMAVIQELQGTRPLIVRLFDELVRTLPDGVYYNTISRTGSIIRIEGNAESDVRLTQLMRDLESSDWFSGAKLGQIDAIPNPGTTDAADRILFQLSVPIINSAAVGEVE